MQAMFTHGFAVSNQPRLAKQLPHLGLRHVKCIICQYDVSAVNVQNLPWVLRPAHGSARVLVLLQVQMLHTSHTPVHGARSTGAVAASAHHACTSSSFPQSVTMIYVSAVNVQNLRLLQLHMGAAFCTWYGACFVLPQVHTLHAAYNLAHGSLSASAVAASAHHART